MKKIRKLIPFIKKNILIQLALIQALLWCSGWLGLNLNWFTLTFISVTQILVWLYLKSFWIRSLVTILLLLVAYRTNPEAQLRPIDGKAAPVRNQHYLKLNPNVPLRFKFKLWDVSAREKLCGPWIEKILTIIGSDIEKSQLVFSAPRVRAVSMRHLATGIYVNQPTTRLTATMDVPPGIEEFEVLVDLQRTKNPQIVIGPHVMSDAVYPEAVYYLARNKKCWVVSYGKRIQ